ncbi:MAG: serine acetyltransferase [Pyrinomonadaceae bacterium]
MGWTITTLVKSYRGDGVKGERLKEAHSQVTLRPLPFWENLVADAEVNLAPEQKPKTGWSRFVCCLKAALGASGFRLMILYRIGHTLQFRFGLPGKIISALIHRWLWLWYACKIQMPARLHGGVSIPHTHGVIIGADVVIGPRSWIFHNVTMGLKPGHKQGMPHIGSDVTIYTGVVLAGPITIGDNVMIGANSVIAHDIPSHSLVRSNIEILPLPEKFIVKDRAPIDSLNS